MSWVWLRKDIILAIHDVQIAEHGGITGVRDIGLLESALARPENLAVYGDPDACALAAAYAFGIARNHPFGDGNKRTAFVAAELFLYFNGFELTANDSDCVMTILRLASGEISEDELAGWIRGNVRPK